MSVVKVTWHRYNPAPDGRSYGQCVRHSGSHATHLAINGEWFCENCFVAALAAGEFTVTDDSTPTEMSVPVDIVWDE